MEFISEMEGNSGKEGARIVATGPASATAMTTLWPGQVALDPDIG